MTSDCLFIFRLLSGFQISIFAHNVHLMFVVEPRTGLSRLMLDYLLVLFS